MHPRHRTPLAPGTNALLLPSEVADRLAISLRTLWRLTAAGTIPQPVRFNRKLVRYRLRDIEHYLEGLAEQLVPVENNR